MVLVLVVLHPVAVQCGGIVVRTCIIYPWMVARQQQHHNRPSYVLQHDANEPCESQIIASEPRGIIQTKDIRPCAFIIIYS
jgi:hypothetical protein